MAQISLGPLFGKGQNQNYAVTLPTLSPTEGLFGLVMSATGAPSPSTDSTVVEEQYTNPGTTRVASRMLHKGFTTQHHGTSVVDFGYVSVPYAFQTFLVSGMSSGYITPSVYGVGNSYTSPYPNVDVQPGDFTAVLCITEDEVRVSPPSGYTEIANKSDTQYKTDWSLVVKDEPWTFAGNVAPVELGRFTRNRSHMYHSIVMRPSGPEGISFQIMHNGQLIPATPQRWNGSSLEPVNLNLPK